MNSLTLLAQEALSRGQTFLVVMVVAMVMLMFMVFFLVKNKCIRCPSNRVLVVFGNTGTADNQPKCIHGGMAFIWPLLQDFAWLSLEPVLVNASINEICKNYPERIKISGVFSTAVGTTPELMQTAAARLLNLSGEEIQKQAENIVSSTLKRVIAATTVEDAQQHRENILSAIEQTMQSELHKIGMTLLNFNADIELERTNP